MDSWNQEIPVYEPIDTVAFRIPAGLPLTSEPPLEEIDVYWILDAVIEDIYTEGTETDVTISYQERQGEAYSAIKMLKLIVSNEFTRIYDQEKEILYPEDLLAGMVIDVLVSSRFEAAIVPEGKAYQIIVVASPLNRDSTTGTIVQVNLANNYLLVAPANAPKEIVRINIEPDTVILSVDGRRQNLYQLMPNMHVMIEHNDYFTSSIPPQTKGNLIKII
ncbi:MAG: hypothetical protein IKL07_10140 [Clostridium sp.]|nr:hypothetical protein [Clostridium sp.]